MEGYIYYGAFAFLLIQCCYGVILLVGSVIQLPFLNRAQSKTGAGFFVLTRFLQGLVTLAVGIILLQILRAETVSPWIPLIACWLFNTAEHFLSRYHMKKAVV